MINTLKDNLFGVYGYDGYTLQEIISQHYNKIIECIDKVNEIDDITLWLVNEGLTKEVANNINKLIKNGTIEEIINNDLFKTLNSTLDSLGEQIETRIEKGKGTLNDFDEQTREILLGLEQGQVNAVLGKKNVSQDNINDNSVLFNHINGKGNLIKYSTVVYDKIVSSAGVQTNMENHYHTDYIDVVGDDYYSISHTLPTTGAWYDSSKNFVGKINPVETLGTNSIIKSPVNARFVRCNFSFSTVKPLDAKLFYGKVSSLSEKRTIDMLNITTSNIEKNSIGGEQLKSKTLLSNLIDKTKVKFNTMLNQYGDEEVAGNINIWTTNYMPIDDTKSYYVKELLSKPGLWYDVNKKVISWLPVGINEPTLLTPPKGAKWVRWTGDSSCPIESTMFIKGNYYPNYFIPYTKDDRFSINGTSPHKDSIGNYLVLGDSISVNSSTTEKFYHEFIKDTLLLDVINCGVSGSGWCVSSSTEDSINSVVNRNNGVYDLITIFAGTNDFGRTQDGVNSKPFGVYGDKNNSTYCGAVYSTLVNIIDRNIDSDIVVITPLPRVTQNTPNKYGKTLKDYVDIIKLTCNELSIPHVDLFTQSGLYVFNEEFKNKYIPDGLHPNIEGHKKIANKIMYGIIKNSSIKE